MLLPGIRARIVAIFFVRKIRTSIVAGDWDIADIGCGETVIYKNEYSIIISPRRLRIFDKINLYFNGAEVWLPLITRIRLRSTVRWYVAHVANIIWDNPVTPKKRSPRKK